ncbi:hypothetical protein [Alicycliphilus denitrificans]|uniref:hypothetical protein n=1 Tax=Alicycliphilus denitrificans TaxID=179636 RepID=UPI00384A9E53
MADELRGPNSSCGFLFSSPEGGLVAIMSHVESTNKPLNFIDQVPFGMNMFGG